MRDKLRKAAGSLKARARRIKASVIVGLASLMLLTGCGAYAAAHDYNAPTPTRIIQPHWTRVETPGNFPSVVRACVGKDGIYVTMDNSSSVEVETNDPACTP